VLFDKHDTSVSVAPLLDTIGTALRSPPSVRSSPARIHSTVLFGDRPIPRPPCSPALTAANPTATPVTAFFIHTATSSLFDCRRSFPRVGISAACYRARSRLVTMKPPLFASGGELRVSVATAAVFVTGRPSSKRGGELHHDEFNRTGISLPLSPGCLRRSRQRSADN